MNHKELVRIFSRLLDMKLIEVDEMYSENESDEFLLGQWSAYRAIDNTFRAVFGDLSDEDGGD